MAFSDYALGLSNLLASLLVPFAVLYQLLRLKRRSVQIPIPPRRAPRGNQR